MNDRDWYAAYFERKREMENHMTFSVDWFLSAVARAQHIWEVLDRDGADADLFHRKEGDNGSYGLWPKRDEDSVKEMIRRVRS